MKHSPTKPNDPLLLRGQFLGKLGRAVASLYERQRWVLHLLFWSGYFIIAFIISSEVLGIEVALIRTSFAVSMQALLVYANFYLIDRFLQHRKIGLYFGFLLLVWLTVGAVRALLATWFLGPSLLGFAPLSGIHLLSIFLSTTIILLLTSAFRLLEDWLEKRSQAEQAHSARLEAELRFLQSQVNPHFLFNMLNMVYAMAYTGSEDTAPTILKLSGMMRYMLEASKKEKVALAEEVDYLRNFIALQAHKRGKAQQVEFVAEGDPKGIRLAPMLFIPFLENAFKHGNISHEDEGWVRGRLYIQPNSVELKLENSLGKTPVRQDAVGGVGLVNIRKRLDLLYPRLYSLDTHKSDSAFGVHLKLQLPSS